MQSSLDPRFVRELDEYVPATGNRGLATDLPRRSPRLVNRGIDVSGRGSVRVRDRNSPERLSPDHAWSLIRRKLCVPQRPVFILNYNPGGQHQPDEGGGKV
jgi:hypothetical protein